MHPAGEHSCWPPRFPKVIHVVLIPAVMALSWGSVSLLGTTPPTHASTYGLPDSMPFSFLSAMPCMRWLMEECCGGLGKSRANGSFGLLVTLQAAGLLTFQMLKSSSSIFTTSNSKRLSFGLYFDSIPSITTQLL